MDGYILELITKYGHLTPKKPQHSPHKHRTIDYRAKKQIVQPVDTSPSLNDKVCVKSSEQKTPCSIDCNRIPASSGN